MITDLPREELIALGEHRRAGYLVEQAGYTFGVAALDGDALAGMLEPGFLDEARKLASAVDAARQDKALSATESTQATSSQHDVIARLKVWRRKIARRAARSRRAGRDIPVELLHVPPATNTPDLVGHAVETLKLVTAHKDKLVGGGVDPLIAEGEGLLAEVRSAEATKDVKRGAELPQAVQDFYVQKGLLYVALKMVNDAGQELHADDPVAASRYNLNILHRRGGGGGGNKPSEPPQAS